MDGGTGSLVTSLSDALSLLPDIRIHASLVLCALVLGWMVAIHRKADAPQPTRRTRRKTMPSTIQNGSDAHPGESTASVPSSGPRRSIVSLARAARPAGGSTAVSSGSFSIRWDRTVIALVAVLALLTALVTGVAALLGAPTAAVAGISLGVAVLGVAGLRLLALRDRKRRTDRQIEAAFDEAILPSTTSRVFDADASAPWAVRPTAEPTGVPAAEAGEQDERSTAGEAASAQPAATTAAAPARSTAGTLPSVPRPTYLDAPEAIRPDQQPLEAAQVKTAQPGTRLKDGVSPEYAARVQSTANRTLDLDKVLERRRAV